MCRMRFSHFAKFIAVCIFVNLIHVQCSDIKSITRITQDEENALNELKRRVVPKITEPFMNDDWYLLRFLKVKNFNVDKAELAVLKYIDWRNDNNFQNVYNEDWSEFEKDYPGRVEGVDKNGQPILTLDFGNWDITKMTNTDKDRAMLVRYYNKKLDEATRKVMELQAAGKNVSKFVYVADMEGVNLNQHVNLQCGPWYWEVIQHLEDFHPDMSAHMMLLNSPSVLSYIMPFVRNILQTNKHLKELGDKSEWKSLLDEIVDPDQLPPKYGGTKGLRPKNRPNNLVGTFQRLQNGKWGWGK